MQAIKAGVRSILNRLEKDDWSYTHHLRILPRGEPFGKNLRMRLSYDTGIYLSIGINGRTVMKRMTLNNSIRVKFTEDIEGYEFRIWSCHDHANALSDGELDIRDGSEYYNRFRFTTDVKAGQTLVITDSRTHRYLGQEVYEFSKEGAVLKETTSELIAMNNWNCYHFANPEKYWVVEE